MSTVLCFGTFDILHPGHVYFLNQAKKLGDFLYVVVSRDETVKKLKEEYPKNSEGIRKEKIEPRYTAGSPLRSENKEIVDQVVLGELGDKYKVIEKIKPDIIALGYDQGFFTDNLKQELEKRKIYCKIVRIKAYHPEKYKTSILKKQSGFLLINKPIGPTSHDIIDKLRKITGIRKIGHAGTLDPFASGLLIVGVGREATREISQFVKMDKRYVAKLKLGYVSDTYDGTGTIKKLPLGRELEAEREIEKIETRDANDEEIKRVLRGFVGEQMQIPPMFSAKKVKGKKLYELARAGKEIERKPAQINIYELELIEYKYPYLNIEVCCSSGTYIRSLANDIGIKLGTGAYLEDLKRAQIGKYKLENAVKLDDLTRENYFECFAKL